ncbi:hypothetical protein OGAPHI_000353 [Ogataea philodendri]|uniref:XPA C-terminal domain-containing protein n=1 Tax=Ogataea philodendri TaxID=1378263 RepID=A0A9P8PG64_9ASCO|nr:uncharacterized protein OGAPHI_000353 [Ogataea philodendri]KAH3671648.1 hypothetical protein OGAPHI_000353 [Ogataea philodendri]
MMDPDPLFEYSVAEKDWTVSVFKLNAACRSTPVRFGIYLSLYTVFFLARRGVIGDESSGFDTPDSSFLGVEGNRSKALEKIRLRQQALRGQTGAVPQKQLTTEQRELIERNRQKALERRRLREQGDGPPPAVPTQDVRLPKEAPVNQGQPQSGATTEFRKVPDRIRPSVKKNDYIEYDFSTMEDTFGGFLSEADRKEASENDKSLEQWQEEQKNRPLVEPAPPLDQANAPKCFECGSIDLNRNLYQVFGCRVCRSCEQKYPEKYSLLTKTECKEDYFLTEPELADEGLFKRIVKENPRSGTYSKMQLFLRFQIEEFAFKKWGSAENLDKEWLRREELRVKRRDKKFNQRLRDMRKKMRAEEFTRKIRGERGERHEHDWSKGVPSGEPGMVKRRCKDCGLEIEEIVM